MLRAGCVVLACLAGCGVRTPAAIDVDALVRARGVGEARRDLVIRITSEPRDVAARLALAALDERIGRPGEAIEMLEAVVKLGGPIGIRWRDADRARLARLIAVRGRARLARGAGSALADLERGRSLGAEIAEAELRDARAAGARVALRHSDAETRARGRRTLGELTTLPVWKGAAPRATVDDRARFGAWLWTIGARRGAWDELAAWHALARPPRAPTLQEAYLVALRWWTPLDRPGPDASELVGPARCGFGGCAAHEVVGDAALERAYLAAPLGIATSDPADVAALVVIALHQALRGELAWGAAITSRVALAAFRDPARLADLPGFARPIVARLVGRTAAAPATAGTRDQRLVLAAMRALDGEVFDQLIEDEPYGQALRRVASSVEPVTGDVRADAAARYAATDADMDMDMEAVTARSATLREIAAAYLRDPSVGDRLARDAVAAAPDGAAMQAATGALFDALGDPARARRAWQAAVDASAEPGYLRGLADALARQGDADAALIAATAAAAASGDPAVVWGAVARSLVGAGKYVHALDAARSAIDLADGDSLGGALDAAIAASRALGRDDQAARLVAQRSAVLAGTTPAALDANDPTDAQAALAAYRQAASEATVARLWTAARWNPRSVELRVALRAALAADDARRGVLAAELLGLAADRDRDVGRAAVAALR